MLIFIDDSGDPGFKTAKGSTRVFVVVLIIFKDNLVAEETSLEIKKLRRDLKWNESHEFKFSKCAKKIRLQFLNRAARFDFGGHAIVVLKEKIYSKILQKDEEKFYNFIVRNLLSHYKDYAFQNATVKIDGRSPKLFRMQFDTYLRKMLNSPKQQRIKKIKHVNSKTDNLIQLADMVAGSVHRSYRPEKTDRSIYIDILSRRIPKKNIWEFG